MISLGNARSIACVLRIKFVCCDRGKDTIKMVRKMEMARVTYSIDGDVEKG